MESTKITEMYEELVEVVYKKYLIDITIKGNKDKIIKKLMKINNIVIEEKYLDEDDKEITKINYPTDNYFKQELLLLKLRININKNYKEDFDNDSFKDMLSLFSILENEFELSNEEVCIAPTTMKVKDRYSSVENIITQKYKNNIIDDKFILWIDKEIKLLSKTKKNDDCEFLEFEIEELKKENQLYKNNQFLIQDIEDDYKTQPNISKFNFNNKLNYLIVSFNMSRKLFVEYDNVDIWIEDNKEKQFLSKIKKYDVILFDSKNTSHTYFNMIKDNAKKWYPMSSVNELKDKLIVIDNNLENNEGVSL